MRTIHFRHYNNCPRCPVIGAEDIPGDEFYEILSLRFNIRIARDLCSSHVPHLVNRPPLERWLEHAVIDWEHVDHLPLSLGPGIMATLPGGCGMPVIDGNHRAARAMRDRHDFFAFVLDEAETQQLLRRSMDRSIADQHWQRMLHSKPHPKDVQPAVQEGEQS
ncbi:hypothetical protein [Acidicapsa ligni]|uniref:hypothetical protein n=1 Tax=Acidicapsa ligni TaxID=542300 RepID=UPI0021DF99B4|nr:hypothetical protein [Acidicapsa ligni]